MAQWEFNSKLSDVPVQEAVVVRGVLSANNNRERMVEVCVEEGIHSWKRVLCEEGTLGYVYLSKISGDIQSPTALCLEDY